MVEHAWAHVPFYRESMSRLGLTPAAIRTDSDLTKLPIVEPEDLNRDPEYFLSDPAPSGGLLEQRTSGSTGEQRIYFRETASLPADATHFTRVLSIAARRAGKRFGLVQASILPPVSSAAKAEVARRASSLPVPRLGVQNTHLSLLDSPEENLARLDQLRPDVIYTFGSYVESLFVHLERTGRAFHQPAAIIYSADPIGEPIRKLVMEDYGIELLGAYQAAEMPQMAFECESHLGLHVNVDLYPMRIVGPDGQDLGDDTDGEVIVSNLVSRGTVLLNYRIGDRARRHAARCTCGRNLPMISLTEGRTDDWLVSGSGALVHPQVIAISVSTTPGIRRYQVVQDEPGRYLMNIVAAPEVDRGDIDAGLRRSLGELLGESPDLEVVFHDSLPASKSGKVRPVISNVSSGLEGAQGPTRQR
jgi:phenylacetate-CoA ligase